MKTANDKYATEVNKAAADKYHDEIVQLNQKRDLFSKVSIGTCSGGFLFIVIGW